MNYSLLSIERQRDGSEVVTGWEVAIKRLKDLAAQDPGYFFLAAHSLIESYINLVRPEYDRDKFKFYDKVNYFNGQSKDVKIPWGFKDTYPISSRVRHYFDNVDRLSQISVGRLLVCFFVGLGLKDLAEFKSFKSSLDASDTKTEFKTASDLLVQKEAELLQSADHMRTYFERINLLSTQIAERDKEQARLLDLKRQLEERVAKKDTDLDGKRLEIFRLETEQAKRNEAIENQTETRRVLEEILDLHHFSKTSLVYEQNLMELSAQQKKVIDSFKPGSNLLVRGGAGTGKTMVLIEAVKALRKSRGESFGFEKEPKIVFLTYTRTLTAYGRYLSELIAQGQGFDEIQTVDAYLNQVANKYIDSNTSINYKFDQQFTTDAEKRYFNELEDFVWARNLSFDAYVTKREPRQGRKTPISPEQRQAVWDFGQKLMTEMVSTGSFSYMGHRYHLASTLDTLKVEADASLVLVIDEVQDLAPVVLGILSRLAKNHLLAGDSRQCIYQKGFSFKSVGIDIVNQSHILKHNFRNPRAIHRVAQDFLQATGIGEDEAEISVARDGLPPRLYHYEPDDLKSTLKMTLDFYQKTLGYEAESIALVSCGISKSTVTSSAASLGHEVIEIKNDEDWIKRKGLKYSTVESSKGLDLPVVILVCGTGADFDLQDEDRQLAKARLLYVGLTRALENLAVLTPHNTKDSTLLRLEGCFTHGR